MSCIKLDHRFCQKNARLTLKSFFSFEHSIAFSPLLGREASPFGSNLEQDLGPQNFCSPQDTFGTIDRLLDVAWLSMITQILTSYLATKQARDFEAFAFALDAFSDIRLSIGHHMVKQILVSLASGPTYDQASRP